MIRDVVQGVVGTQIEARMFTRSTARYGSPPDKMGLLCKSLFLCLTLISGCSGLPQASPPSSAVVGKVTQDGIAVHDAEVYVYRPRFHLEPSRGPAGRARTRQDGTFRVNAPEGTYLVVARKGDRFAYFGRNPVRLSSSVSGLHLPLLRAHPISRYPTREGAEGIEGRVLRGGLPVAGARVFAYLEAARGLRGPGYALSEPTDQDGAYWILLPPGTYFVAARFRAGGWRVGSLQPGDLFGVLHEFPITVGSGEKVWADIETLALPGREKMGRFQGNFASIEGRIVDGDGRPVGGMRACLYGSAQMLDRPLVVSDPSGEDGTFALDGVAPGPYYLGARDVLGGPPAPGERVGFYRGPQGTYLALRPGAHLDALTVVVQIVP